MAQCKTAVSLLQTHWRYCRAALNHRYIDGCHRNVATSSLTNMSLLDFFCKNLSLLQYIILYKKYIKTLLNLSLHNNSKMSIISREIWALNIIAFWFIDATKRRRSWATLVEVMACCLPAPSINLNQYWAVMSSGIQLTTISEEMHKISVIEICLEINSLRPNDAYTWMCQ